MQHIESANNGADTKHHYFQCAVCAVFGSFSDSDNTSMTETWRDTLFVWDGILQVTEANNSDKGDEEEENVAVKWEGTWVGRENCPDAKKAEPPKRGAFDKDVASDMCFAVEGTAQPAEGGTEVNNSVPYRATMIEGEGWDLGEGSDKKKHKDTRHELLLANLRWSGSRDQRNNTIFACGENDHGSFISAGWVRPGNRLTLGRRYLAEGDERAKWDLDELRSAVLEEVFDEGQTKVRIPPWQCDALHSELRQNSKKRKLESSKAEDATTKQ